MLLIWICSFRWQWRIRRGALETRAPSRFNFFHYRPQRSCGQGNIFTPVCHSVHGGCLPQCMLGYHTRRELTPPGSRNPPGADTPHRLPGPGGVSAWSGGCLPGLRGCLPGPGGCLAGPGGSPVPGGSPWQVGGSPYWRPPLWTEWQTGVNIVPWPQLRCGR